jgi:hypothetical protein
MSKSWEFLQALGRRIRKTSRVGDLTNGVLCAGRARRRQEFEGNWHRLLQLELPSILCGCTVCQCFVPGRVQIVRQTPTMQLLGAAAARPIPIASFLHK